MMSELKFYWRMMLRRLPLLLSIVILCSALGLVQALRLPAVYATEARLLVELPEIDFDGPGADTSVDEEIQIIRERLLTRANLLDIAHDFDVLEDYSALPPDTIFNLMRASTVIRSTGGRNQATVITVSFSGRSGQIAADVVNEYVTRIISANQELQIDLVEGTLDFFQQEVERLSAELDSRSARISQFQAENADALPGNQEFRLSRQAVLQERISGAQRELSALIDQRARIIELYEATGQVTTSDATLSDDERQLRDLERELATQLTIYSEEAPQVVLLRGRIEVLREQISASVTANPAAPVNSSQALLDLQLGQIDVQVENLEVAIAESDQELERLEDAIARTPANAIALSSLERDYENIRSQYDNAVSRLAQASTDDRITRTSRGQRITLIEPAAVPRTPSSPNRKLIALMGGVAGVGLAAALFVLFELLNQKVRRPAEITRSLGIEPLVSIPYIQTRTERLTQLSLRVAAILIVVVGLPALLWSIDSFYMPLDMLAGEMLNRIRSLI